MPFCPHGLNEKTCLTCFRLPKPGAAPAQRGGPDVERNHLGAPMGFLPGRKPAPVMGNRDGAHLGTAVSGAVPVSAEEREKYRNPKGLAVPPLPPEQRATLRMDGVTTQEPWGVDRDGHEVAPQRGSLIDRLPSPPKARV